MTSPSRPETAPLASSSGKPTWTCSVCTSELLCQPNYIENCQVCAPCIRRLFELALVDTTAWPPRWGSQVLDHRDFRHVLDLQLLQRLDVRTREQGCPVAERVYCRQQHPPGRDRECNAFIGRRSTGEPVCKLCRQCGLYTCLRCLKRFPYVSEAAPETRIRHYCHIPPEHDNEAARQELDAAFRHLTRGKDYQECPGCKLRVELLDGCNHLTCTCGEQFCYLCGRRAREASQHWDQRSGGCPRYGQPGAQQALYSEEIAFGDNELDSESDGEHEDFVRYAVPRMLDIQERREFARRQQQDELREQGRHYARELAQNWNHQAALARAYGEAGNDELWDRAAIELRRDAIDHGRPNRPQHIRPAEMDDSTLSHDRGGEHVAARRSFDSLSRHDQARREEVARRAPVLELGQESAYRLHERAQRPHHRRSWQVRELAMVGHNSSDGDASLGAPIAESSRHATQRAAAESRSRRESLRSRRRARDIVVPDDSGYDSVSGMSDAASQTSLRSYEQPRGRASSRQRAASAHSLPEHWRRPRHSSTLERPRPDRRTRSEHTERVSGREELSDSSSDSDHRAAEQEAFVRQYGRGRRLGGRSNARPRRNIAGWIWSFCQDVGDAILRDHAL